MPFFSSSWYRVADLKPKLRRHATVHRHRYRGVASYVIHDHATGRIHRISQDSCAIVSAMDGVRTVHEIWKNAIETFGEDAPSQDETIQLMVRLYAADLLQTEAAPDLADLLKRSTTSERSSMLRNMLNPFSWRLRLWNPDVFFDRTTPFVNWLFGWTGLAIWILAVLPAIFLAAQHWQELTENAAERILAADNLLMIALSYPVLKALHELGHGYAVKSQGGAVPEVGVMFLVFVPMPYVDASAAAEFPNKWRRALVGAAGMIVETFVAAIALYVWLLLEPGNLRALAYNVMLVAGVSTLWFNGNPLLRFDGYYILADLLEIPNLAQRANRYWGYLIERYVFRTEDAEDLPASTSERVWLFLYAPVSFVYRQAILFMIALFVASEYLAVGIALAVWALFMGVLLPVAKSLWKVVADVRFLRNRARAVTTTFGCIATVYILLFWIPAPLYTTSEGVVWLPERALVRAGADGFVRHFVTQPGQTVRPGDPLIESVDPTISAEIAYLKARVSEFEARLASEQFADRAKAEITTTELTHARAELATRVTRAERLIVRSSAHGTFAVMRPEDLPDRFVREGQQIGYVLPSGSRVVRTAIRQDDIDLVRNQLRSTSVKLSERLEQTIPAHIIHEVPAGGDALPSKALGGRGGGALAVDPRDTQGTKTLQRTFQFDLELPSDASPAVAFGTRVHVRFDHHWEPVGRQLWRRVRQTLLSHLRA
jgi:putative peptide zinc metalloprotease protein